jgi:hypothetical protein
VKVLIGCETSGVVRNAFIARGHDAWSSDLLPADDGGNHILCEHGKHLLEIARRGWDLFIVHPPCTYLSVSGMHWTTRGLRDPKLTDEAIRFAEECWEATVQKLALENPVGVLSTRSKLGEPTQIIQPFGFGEPESKKTCLWLRGLTPLQIATVQEPDLFLPMLPKPEEGHWNNQTASGQNKLAPSKDRWKLRSKTYEGIARAMAEQWG